MNLSHLPGTARYRPIGPLGAGAMGIVVRAHDRLTGREVALKQVTLVPGMAPEETARELHALAREFRLLAGLSHPHIISVLDYGFDAERRPFFTMELLRGAQTILEAGRALPRAGQAALLLQALEALAYLHRRGVLHHDLKPANVLVAEGRVRLLDFGLAVPAGQARDDDAFGTIQYLAPEVLDGQPYTEAADLYGLGVIAYELLVGRHPFAAHTLRDFAQRLAAHDLDLSALAETPQLADAIAQLLAPQPRDRPATAHSALSLLRASLGAPAREAQAIRESYLRAATFVGREAELAQLAAALDHARDARGSAWLVGGESGVGKTRLLDELRTHALVAGFAVLQGQAVEGGGAPFQLWRDPIKHMALDTPLSALEASVVKPLAPRLEALLGQMVPDAPDLPGEEGQLRVAHTIAALLRRRVQPTLVILEDLHWAAESLLPLRLLLRSVRGLPLLILASYRNDERPNLPAELPGTRVLPLTRLSDGEIAQLSQAMLGESGGRPAVVELLQRETEGNAFFAVEVMRALADAAGDLERIGRMALPRAVLAGGVQSIVRRRLARVPAWASDLLRLAAVAGRQLDLAVLRELLAAQPAGLGADELELWLATCAELAVLEIRAGQWRFAHDRLREGLLGAIAAEQLPRYHRAVAEATERAYRDQGALTPHLEPLLGHWQAAGDRDKEIAYALLVAEQVYRLGGQDAQARRLMERVLTLLERAPHAERQTLAALRLQAHALTQLAEYPEAARQYERGIALAAQLGDQETRGLMLVALAVVYLRQGRADLSQTCLTQSFDIGQALDSARILAGAYATMGRLHISIGDYQSAGDVSHQALQLYHALGDREGEVACLRQIGGGYENLGDYGAALRYAERSLVIARELGAKRAIGEALSDLGNIYTATGELELAISYHQQALAISQEIGERRGVAFDLFNLSVVAAYQARWDDAAQWAAEAHEIAVEIDEPLLVTVALYGCGDAALGRGDAAAADGHFGHGLEVAGSIGSRTWALWHRYGLGNCALHQRQPEAAFQHYAEALALADETADYRATVTLLGVTALAEHRLGLRRDAFRRLADAIAIAWPSPRATEKLELLAAAAAVLAEDGERALAQRCRDAVEAHPHAFPLWRARVSALPLPESAPDAAREPPDADALLAAIASHLARYLEGSPRGR